MNGDRMGTKIFTAFAAVSFAALAGWGVKATLQWLWSEPMIADALVEAPWVDFEVPGAGVRLQLPSSPETLDLLDASQLVELGSSLVFARQHLSANPGVSV